MIISVMFTDTTTENKHFYDPHTVFCNVTDKSHFCEKQGAGRDLLMTFEASTHLRDQGDGTDW